MKQIPLRNRKGAVVAYALVDDEDFGWLMQWRWTSHSQGYVCRSSGKRMVLMHRQIMGLEHGDRRQVHHDNEDKLDNRRKNLIAESASSHNNRHHTGRHHRVDPTRGIQRKPSGRYGVYLSGKSVGTYDTIAECVEAKRHAIAQR